MLGEAAVSIKTIDKYEDCENELLCFLEQFDDQFGYSLISSFGHHDLFNALLTLTELDDLEGAVPDHFLDSFHRRLCSDDVEGREERENLFIEDVGYRITQVIEGLDINEQDKLLNLAMEYYLSVICVLTYVMIATKQTEPGEFYGRAEYLLNMFQAAGGEATEDD